MAISWVPALLVRLSETIGTKYSNYDCKYIVYEEVHGLTLDGSNRRIDMLAIPLGSYTRYIIDPKIRTESYGNQPAEVHIEKCRIYEPTIPYYLEKYKLTDIEVIGLMVGARGTIPRLFVNFCRRFNINKTSIYNIALAAIKGSIKILRNHL